MFTARSSQRAATTRKLARGHILSHASRCVRSMALDLIVCVLALLPVAWRAQQLGLGVGDAAFLSTPHWWACVAGISLLYVLHAYIWYCSAAFSSACARAPLRGLGANPVQVFSRLEILGKVWQLSMVLLLLGHDGVAAAQHGASTASQTSGCAVVDAETSMVTTTMVDATVAARVELVTASTNTIYLLDGVGLASTGTQTTLHVLPPDRHSPAAPPPPLPRSSSPPPHHLPPRPPSPLTPSMPQTHQPSDAPPPVFAPYPTDQSPMRPRLKIMYSVTDDD